MRCVVPLLLACLAVTDAGFAGFRDAAGRNARVFKEEYYRRAIRRGLRFGLSSTTATGLLVLCVVLFSPSPGARLDELLATGARLVPVLAAYATLVLVAVGVWAAAEADARTLASVVILGPFTMIRPYVIAAAGAYAAWGAPSIAAAVVALAACAVQLCVEPWMGRAWRRGSPLAQR